MRQESQVAKRIEIKKDKFISRVDLAIKQWERRIEALKQSTKKIRPLKKRQMRRAYEKRRKVRTLIATLESKLKEIRQDENDFRNVNEEAGARFKAKIERLLEEMSHLSFNTSAAY
ncbi:MAG: hypothetical protein HY537_00840 [Deltaproteobacteria bacterium]|nr:hypothetical protein [Deltaproteobacteria bacterium]